jgi:hypothetical protein
MRAVAKPLAAACAALLAAAPAFADAAGPAPSTSDAGMCQAGAPPSLPSMEAFARLQARLQAEAAAAGEDAPIVLNGRGYNYGTPRDPVRELQVLQAERARAQR